MKNYRLLAGVVICGFALQSPLHAQQAMTAAQVDAIVRPTLKTCDSISGGATTARVQSSALTSARVLPIANRKSVATNRIAKTLNGVWRGEVLGDTGDVHVDYFWIIDTKANEALIIAQRSGKETVDAPALPTNAPKLTYLMCAHDGYSPGSNTPQIHQFVKVSSSTDNAAELVEKATGYKSTILRPSLADLWRGLIATGYFDSLPYVAYAGGFFKPLQIASTPSLTKGAAPQISMRWDAEYRGGGTTKLKYTTGVPMTGSEQVQFVGAAAKSGDYLLSSAGNGNLWKVEVVAGGDYNLAFDQVTLGPIE